MVIKSEQKQKPDLQSEGEMTNNPSYYDTSYQYLLIFINSTLSNM